jgi:hypothetical protein
MCILAPLRRYIQNVGALSILYCELIVISMNYYPIRLKKSVLFVFLALIFVCPQSLKITYRDNCLTKEEWLGAKVA